MASERKYVGIVHVHDEILLLVIISSTFLCSHGANEDLNDSNRVDADLRESLLVFQLLAHEHHSLLHIFTHWNLSIRL